MSNPRIAAPGVLAASAGRMRDRLVLAIVWGVAIVYLVDTLQHVLPNAGFDSHAYWTAARGRLPYDRTPGEADAYLYSPLFAQLVRPLALLPWPIFQMTWAVLLAVALGWLLLPVALRWSVPALLFCLPELILGNVYLLLAASVVLGMTRAAAWSFGMLTKVTPAVGLLWYAATGDRRRLVQGLGAVVLLAALSAAADPSAWLRWLELLLNAGNAAWGPLAPSTRLAVAAVLIAGAGGDDRRRWVVAVALLIANPMWGGATTPLTLLTAVPRLVASGRASTWFPDRALAAPHRRFLV